MVKKYSLLLLIVWVFFHSCSIFQALVPYRLSAYRKSWGKAKFIISTSLLEEIQKVSWSIKTSCLLRNTTCLFLTNYSLYCFTIKSGPKKTVILETSHKSSKETLFWRKKNTLLRSKYKVCKWSANCNGEFLLFWLATVYHNSCYYILGKYTYLWNSTHVQSNLLRWGLLMMMRLSKKQCCKERQIQRRSFKVCSVVCVQWTISSPYQREDNLI